MSETITNPTVTTTNNPKKPAFFLPALLAIGYLISNGIANMLSLVGNVEVVKMLYEIGAKDTSRSYYGARVAEAVLDLIYCVLTVIFVYACLETALNKKQAKGKAKIFYIVSIAFQVVNFIVIFIRETFMYIDAFAAVGLFVGILPWVMWFVLLLLSETKDNNTIRIITIVAGGIFTVSSAVVTLGNLVMFLGMGESPLLPYENKTQLFSSIGSTLLYLSITLYQLLGFKKKEKPQQYVVQPQYAQPVYQPIYQPQPTYQPPQPVAPAPINQPSTEERLATIQKLFDDNVITQEEYDKKRAEILSGI